MENSFLSSKIVFFFFEIDLKSLFVFRSFIQWSWWWKKYEKSSKQTNKRKKKRIERSIIQSTIHHHQQMTFSDTIFRNLKNVDHETNRKRKKKLKGLIVCQLCVCILRLWKKMGGKILASFCTNQKIKLDTFSKKTVQNDWLIYYLTYVLYGGGGDGGSIDDHQQKTTNYSGTSIDFDLSVMRIGIGHTKHKHQTPYITNFWWTLWWWTDVLTTHTTLTPLNLPFFSLTQYRLLPASQPKNHFWTHLEFIHSFKQLWLIVSWMWNPPPKKIEWMISCVHRRRQYIIHSIISFHFMQTNTLTERERERMSNFN